ncbi:MAG: addiction module protein [Verrucomicrobiaceae bacterium]|nr:addiction module protein [Verrucomicrobiaceae bacterium]
MPTPTLPLSEMSVAEKLQLIEVLWEDLSKNPDDIPSPDWHKEVLDECRRKAETGEERFVDWETAKAEIRRRTS